MQFMKGCVTVPGWVGGGVPWGIQCGHQRKGGLWISLKIVNFFRGHGARIRVFRA